MLNIKKILLPADFPITSLDVVHQAAILARHFHSEIVMLHVVTALSHAAGVPEDDRELAGWDLLTEIIKEAQKQRDPSLVSECGTLVVGTSARWLGKARFCRPKRKCGAESQAITEIHGRAPLADPRPASLRHSAPPCIDGRGASRAPLPDEP